MNLDKQDIGLCADSSQIPNFIMNFCNGNMFRFVCEEKSSCYLEEKTSSFARKSQIGHVLAHAVDHCFLLNMTQGPLLELVLAQQGQPLDNVVNSLTLQPFNSREAMDSKEYRKPSQERRLPSPERRVTESRKRRFPGEDEDKKEGGKKLRKLDGGTLGMVSEHDHAVDSVNSSEGEKRIKSIHSCDAIEMQSEPQFLSKLRDPDPEKLNLKGSIADDTSSGMESIDMKQAVTSDKQFEENRRAIINDFRPKGTSPVLVTLTDPDAVALKAEGSDDEDNGGNESEGSKSVSYGEKNADKRQQTESLATEEPPKLYELVSDKIESGNLEDCWTGDKGGIRETEANEFDSQPDRKKQNHDFSHPKSCESKSITDSKGSQQSPIKNYVRRRDERNENASMINKCLHEDVVEQIKDDAQRTDLQKPSPERIKESNKAKPMIPQKQDVIDLELQDTECRSEAKADEDNSQTVQKHKRHAKCSSPEHNEETEFKGKVQLQGEYTVVDSDNDGEAAGEAKLRPDLIEADKTSRMIAENADSADSDEIQSLQSTVIPNDRAKENLANAIDDEASGENAMSESGSGQARDVLEQCRNDSCAAQTSADDDSAWNHDHHRAFVEAIFEIGLKNCSPTVIMDGMVSLLNRLWI